MLRKLIAPFFTALGILAIIHAGSYFPPIIARSTIVAEPSEHDLILVAEYGFCQNNLNDINCGCFAGKAGHVLADGGLGIRGAYSVNRLDLARGQAIQSC